MAKIYFYYGTLSSIHTKKKKKTCKNIFTFIFKSIHKNIFTNLNKFIHYKYINFFIKDYNEKNKKSSYH